MHSSLFNESFRLLGLPPDTDVQCPLCLCGVPLARIGRCYQGPDADGHAGQDYGGGAE